MPLLAPTMMSLVRSPDWAAWLPGLDVLHQRSAVIRRVGERRALESRVNTLGWRRACWSEVSEIVAVTRIGLPSRNSPTSTLSPTRSRPMALRSSLLDFTGWPFTEVMTSPV